MRYSLSVSKRQFARMPLVLKMLGMDHEQDPIFRPEGFPLWQILFCVAGAGEFVFADSRGTLRPGQIAVLSPGEAHSYHSLGGDWTVHYVGFDGNLCLKLLSVLGMDQSGVYSLAHPQLLLQHLRALEALVLQGDNDRTAACSKELYALLLDLSHQLTRLPDSRYEEAGSMEKEMILYLEDHFSEDISLEMLAAQFQRTPEYLCSCFKAATGETIMHYLRRVRIHRAKLLLMERPDAGLREIAEACGFRSVSYFGKVFREATGFTPQSYRLGAGSGLHRKPEEAE